LKDALHIEVLILVLIKYKESIRNLSIKIHQIRNDIDKKVDN